MIWLSIAFVMQHFHVKSAHELPKKKNEAVKVQSYIPTQDLLHQLSPIENQYNMEKLFIKKIINDNKT